MGYYSNKQIAKITEPKELTLSGNPNFITIESVNDTSGDIFFSAQISCKNLAMGAIPDYIPADRLEALIRTASTFTIRLKESNTSYTFQGTYDKTAVNNSTFYIAKQGDIIDNSDIVLSETQALGITAQNIRTCLLANSFLRNNYEINIISTIFSEELICDNSYVTIKGKGKGPQYNFDIELAEFDEPLTLFDNETWFITATFTGYPDSLMQNDLFGYSYRSPDDRYSIGTFTGVYLEETERYPGSVYVVRPQDNGLTMEECRQETLKNLGETLNNNEYFNIFYSATYDETNKYLVLIRKADTLDYTIALSLNPVFGTLTNGNRLVVDVNLETKITYATSSDSIDGGKGNYRIDLDIYENTKTFLGNSKGELCNEGNYLTTLSKAYSGQPLWFDLNTLMNKRAGYSPNFLDNDNTWADTGTISSYRFVAKRSGEGSNLSVYYSYPLYVLKGYDALLKDSDMEQPDNEWHYYAMNFSQKFNEASFDTGKALTTMQSRTHIKGQEQYFNFIALNINKGPYLTVNPPRTLPTFCLHYKLYTQSGNFITEYTSHEMNEKEFYSVNTARLDLDRFLPTAPNQAGTERPVGRIDVCLSVSHYDENYNINIPLTPVSAPLTFRILPENLHTVNNFAFLNRLGGWDTMNFGGTASTDFKTTASTIFKTLQPQAKPYAEVESVVARSVQEQIVAQTSPVTYEVVEWLRQMSASPAVYELRTKRYIVVDEMNLKYNTTDDLFQIEMKYHYTDSSK
ncbi:hypothetical protein [Dysgonomonas macrotermitis]|uniref:Uncharacterized protein n=1 Tax=Dysgonomonas macrotermitis TaxID=1346286 RepID=A0A1M5HEB9_9BACT|nr:hypothetical protein [Dysgonomonas macrotermitis]SHG14300.1 hypothetical protein SAMN05444362_11641 [Dysgonomonas macrotermitis]